MGYIRIPDEEHLIRRVGITGPRNGPNNNQYNWLRHIIDSLPSSCHYFHHGDCFGVDEQGATFAKSAEFTIVAHPPLNTKYQQPNKSLNDTVLPPKDYLVRNHDIVNTVDLMLALPNTYNEVLRSGTWATMRYAKNTKRDMIVIWPNGNRTINTINWPGAEAFNHRGVWIGEDDRVVYREPPSSLYSYI